MADSYVATCPYCDEIVMAVLDTKNSHDETMALVEEYKVKNYIVEKVDADKNKIVIGKCTCIHKGEK